MDLDTDTDTDSLDHNNRTNCDEIKHLQRALELYFNRLLSSTSFINHMNLRCTNINDSTSYILLCEAIKRNDNICAQTLIHYYCKANVGCPDPGKDIPLHLAILAGNVEVVELLLSNGARASVSFQDQKEPLHLICDKSCSSIPNENSRIAIAKLLLKFGANVNAVEKTRKDSPLILAVRSKYFELTKFLLASGCDRHYSNKYAETVLHTAFSANVGNDMIGLLYDEGFDLQQVDENNCTVFSYAVSSLMNSGYGTFGNLNEPVKAILFLLKKGVSVNTQLMRGNRILHMICQNNAARTMKIFLDHGVEVNARNIDGETALHFCAGKQSIDLVKLLIDYGADVHALTNSGQSVIHFAATNKHPKVLETLLRYGLDINAKGRDGNFTPLFNAVWSNRYDNAKLLLDWRANVNERLINRQIALHVAVDQKHTSCVELLLEHESDINVLDDYGNTPLTISLYQIVESANSDFDTEGIRPTKTVQRILTKHTAKMFLMSQYLSEQSLRIMNDSNFCDFYADCIRELNLMRDSKLSKNITLFDILTKKSKLLSYFRNDEFMKALRDSQYKERFPIYCDNLYRNVKATAERFELLKESTDNLIKIVQNVDKSWAHVYLPSLVADYILSYLNLSDLKNLGLVFS